MSRKFNPPGINPPLSTYHHAVETPSGARWLHVSGQLGISPDGSIPDGIVAQTEVIFENFRAILAEADMDFGDLVRVNAYLVHAEDRDGCRTVRERYLKDHMPASTMIVIKALTDPRLLVEIEFVAAKVD